MIDIVLCIPEITKGMKSFGPKSLIQIYKKTLIEHQIINLRKNFKRNKIYIFSGFCSDKIKKSVQESSILKKGKSLEIIEDNKYYMHGPLYLINDYMKKEPSKDGALFINSGIITNHNFSKDIDKKNNCNFFIDTKSKNNFYIGSNNSGYLFYDLPNVWSECFYLCRNTLDKIANPKYAKKIEKMFCFEILNTIQDDLCIEINKKYISKNQICKINHIKDINSVRKIIKGIQ